MVASEADDARRLVPHPAQVGVIDDSGQVIVDSLPDSLPSALFEAALIKFAASCMAAASGQLRQLEQAIAAAQTETLAQLARQQRIINGAVNQAEVKAFNDEMKWHLQEMQQQGMPPR